MLSCYSYKECFVTNLKQNFQSVEFSVFYLILYEEVSLGIYVWLFEKKDISFI